MSSITTKTGDNGESGLLGGARANKTDQRFEALGAIDELNAALGMAKAVSGEKLKSPIEALQCSLLALGSEIATQVENFDKFSNKFLAENSVEELHVKIKELEKPVTYKGFELLGKNPCSATLHYARTIARRAEREVWRLHEQQPLKRMLPCVYLNRLSDYLWLLAEAAE